MHGKDRISKISLCGQIASKYRGMEKRLLIFSKIVMLKNSTFLSVNFPGTILFHRWSKYKKLLDSCQHNSISSRIQNNNVKMLAFIFTASSFRKNPHLIGFVYNLIGSFTQLSF